jgi:hypothetical protein
LELPRYTDADLLEEVQRRAVRFFWEEADPQTGLAKDRARNSGEDDHFVGSTATTGYGLVALVIAVERGWVDRDEAIARGTKTLQFLLNMPNQHGWLTHFVDKRTGTRVWNSEFSSIDTALMVAGALVCAEYFSQDQSGAELKELVDGLYSRIDWWWMLTNGGTQINKRIMSHGLREETGFLTYNYGAYSEAILLYLLGMGAETNPLPPECWAALDRPIYAYAGFESLRGGSIFIHQMPSGYFNFRNRRDDLGFDYWVSSENAMKIDRRFCADRSPMRTTYAQGFWGLNASDGPKDYVPYGAYDAREDGTVSPTGAISSIIFDPVPAIEVAQAMYQRLGAMIWGKYGFADAFNLDQNWASPDVIGMDLGMALLAIENYRSGLIWRLMDDSPVTARAFEAASLRITSELEPRPLRIRALTLYPG